VLIADDDPSARALVAEVLRGAGFATVEAGDGEQALARARALRPRAVVLDLTMPKLDGFQVLEALRADRSLQDVPVLVLTATQMSPEQRARLSAEVQGLLDKAGATAVELSSALVRALRRPPRDGVARA
jgi:CheY-like chemotaxis protein